jgi:hypothetical protein
MSRVEEKVFTDKLAALRYNREHAAQFYVATVPGEEPKQVYVVAISLHRAQVAMVAYLMGLTKWTKKQQDEAYIAALEAEAAKPEDKDQP